MSLTALERAVPEAAPCASVPGPVATDRAEEPPRADLRWLCSYREIVAEVGDPGIPERVLGVDLLHLHVVEVLVEQPLQVEPGSSFLEQRGMACFRLALCMLR